MKLPVIIFAASLVPTLATAQPATSSPHAPQPRTAGQWCPEGWSTSGSFCVPGSDKAPTAIAKPANGWCPAGWRTSGSYCIR
jgi:hypothetical protein